MKWLVIIVLDILFFVVVACGQIDEFASRSYSSRDMSSSPSSPRYGNPFWTQSNIATYKELEEIIEGGKREVQRYFEYDTSGYVVRYEFYHRGKLHNTYHSIINDKGQVIESIRKNKRAKFSSHWIYTRDSTGYVTQGISMNMDGDRIVAIYQNIRNSSGQRIEYVSYGKRGKFNSRWKYTFYANGSRKSTVQMDSKNRILHEWKFDCEDEGVLVEKKKGLVGICIKEEIDTLGYRKVVMRQSNDKGKIIKSVYRFDPDSNLVDVRKYNMEDKLEQEYILRLSDGTKTYQYTSYNKNGKQQWAIRGNYDTNGDYVLEEIFKKGKLAYGVDITYNEKHLKTSVRTRGDKIIWHQVFEYTFHE